MDSTPSQCPELTIEQRLAQERAILQYVVDNIPYLIFWKDRQSRYLGCNKNFAALDGRADPSQMVGKTDYDTVWKAYADEYREGDRATMDRGEPILDKEERTPGPDGQERVILTSKVPLRNDPGDVIGLLGIIVDITERKRIEVELQRAKEAAESAASARSDFMANISHELRTPLTLVLGSLESLLAGRAGALGDGLRAQLERARRNGARLSNLVDDLLDFSKVEAGKAPPSWEACDVSELVSCIVQDAQAVAASRRIDLALSTELPGAALMVDRRMLEKITLNLLGNALKFTPPGGRVEVALRSSAERFELSVEDTGSGIPASRRHLLFQRFQQLDAAATRKYEGTGLGLALVKEFAQAMGGDVGVESEAGRGARFFVRLPRTVATEAAPPTAARAQRPAARLDLLAPPAAGCPRPKPAAPAGTVLVAEDNPELRAHLVEIVGAAYEVIDVENGRAALDAARARRPDVIVSDVMMPEMSGFELVAALKSDPALRAVPVLLLTARAGTEAIVTGLEGGADDYLAKPFHAAELLARVRAAHRLYRARGLELTHDELLHSQELVRHADRLQIAAELSPSPADARLPPVSPARRVAVAEVVERAIAAATAIDAPGARGRVSFAEGTSSDITVTVAPDDLEAALRRVLTFLLRVEAPAAPIHVTLEPGARGVRVRVGREGWRPDAARDVFMPRLHQGDDGAGRLDVDLTVAKVLVLRNDGRLHFEDAAGGGALVFELSA
jgi:PAS domain S-box-containing protein